MITLSNINISHVLYPRIDLAGIRLGVGGGGRGQTSPIPGLEGVLGLYSGKGLTNEQMSANPVWKDKSGLGNDLQMKNFAWAEMSGVGGYNYNFTHTSIFNYAGPNIGAKVSSDTLFIEKVDRSRVNCTIKLNQFKCQLKVTGVTKAIDNGEIQRLRIYSSKDAANSIYIEKDGIYDADVLNPEGGLIYIFANSPQIDVFNPLTLTSPIVIEQLPLYSGAIVFDGVDDYGICETFPILTKEKGYTVMALRKYISSDNLAYLVSNGFSVSGAFLFEGNDLNDCWNFGGVNTIKGYVADLVTYQTSKLYNGKELSIGSVEEGLDAIYVARRNATYANVAIYSLVIIDHDTTEEERQLVIDYWKKEFPGLLTNPQKQII